MLGGGGSFQPYNSLLTCIHRGRTEALNSWMQLTKATQLMTRKAPGMQITSSRAASAPGSPRNSSLSAHNTILEMEILSSSPVSSCHRSTWAEGRVSSPGCWRKVSGVVGWSSSLHQEVKAKMGTAAHQWGSPGELGEERPCLRTQEGWAEDPGHPHQPGAVGSRHGTWYCSQG